MKPCIIDFESSGLEYPNSYPIEVGVILEDGSVYESLIKPIDEWDHWDFSAQQDAHGIPRQLLKDCGKDVTTVAKELNEFIGDYDVYCDGRGWDEFWCSRLFEAAGTFSSFEVWDLFSIMTPQVLMKWHDSKDQAVKLFQQKGLPLHRAGNDVQIIQTAFEIAHKT